MVATVHQDRCEWIKLISSTRLTRLVQDVLSGLFELELVQMFITKLLTHPDKLNLIVKHILSIGHLLNKDLQTFMVTYSLGKLETDNFALREPTQFYQCLELIHIMSGDDVIEMDLQLLDILLSNKFTFRKCTVDLYLSLILRSLRTGRIYQLPALSQ